jgi:hypothetical protein
MKQAILFIFSILSLGAFAQTTGTFTYRIVDESDTLFFTIYATPDKITLDGSIEEDYKERVVVDVKQKKVLELLDDEEGNEAYITTWETEFDNEEEILISDISEFILMGPAPEGTYKLMPDKKVIHGIPCQKFEFIDEETGEAMSTGWYAPGLHIKVSETIAFMELNEGVIIQMQSIGDDGVFVFELAAYKKTIDNPTAAFSLVVPEGYELIDLDSLDSEIEETEEGEE